MKIIHGFITIAQYVKNTPGIVSAIGELSTYSRTYSKEKGEYLSSSAQGYQLTTFRSIDTITKTNTEVSQTLVDEILSIAKSIVAYAGNNLRPYDTVDFKNTIAVENFSTIANLELGDLVFGTQGIDLPGFASWNSKANDYSEIRVWFSDQTFADQYTGYDITIIPPVTNLATFFLDYNQAKTVLDGVSVSTLGEAIQTAKQRNPETVVRLLEFNLVNRYDQTTKMKTSWGVLIYGKEGDYIDAIKDAISDYLLNNSVYKQEQWELILPDIFKRTEMVVVPRWDNIAVQNLTDNSSLYSSIIGVKEADTFLKSFIKFYDAPHISSNSYIIPYPFKTIVLCIVNGIKNTIEKNDFKKVYPDFMPIPSTSLDFARMSLTTQNFILFLDDLLIWAERANTLSPLPTGLRRVIRNTKLFISGDHNGINFLVAAKFNTDFN